MFLTIAIWQWRQSRYHILGDRDGCSVTIHATVRVFLFIIVKDDSKLCVLRTGAYLDSSWSTILQTRFINFPQLFHKYETQTRLSMYMYMMMGEKGAQSTASIQHVCILTYSVHVQYLGLALNIYYLLCLILNILFYASALKKSNLQLMSI